MIFATQVHFFSGFTISILIEVCFFTVTYTNWRGNEPNSDNERCGEMYTDGGWNDQSCNSNREFVCEIGELRSPKHQSISTDLRHLKIIVVLECGPHKLLHEKCCVIVFSGGPSGGPGEQPQELTWSTFFYHNIWAFFSLSEGVKISQNVWKKIYFFSVSPWLLTKWKQLLQISWWQRRIWWCSGGVWKGWSQSGCNFQSRREPIHQIYHWVRRKNTTFVSVYFSHSTCTKIQTNPNLFFEKKPLTCIKCKTVCSQRLTKRTFTTQSF